MDPAEIVVGDVEPDCQRKTVFEREQFGCIGGAAAEHCHGHPLFVGIGFPPNPAGTWCPPGFAVNVRGHTRPMTRRWGMRLARNNIAVGAAGLTATGRGQWLLARFALAQRKAE